MLKEDGRTQNYLVFQSLYKHFRMVDNVNKVTAGKWKRLHDGSTKPPLTCDNSLNPGINHGSCLNQDKVTFTSKSVLHFCIICEINSCPPNLYSKFTLTIVNRLSSVHIDNKTKQLNIISLLVNNKRNFA